MNGQTFKLKFAAVVLLLIGMITFSRYQTAKSAGKDLGNAAKGIQNSAG